MNFGNDHYRKDAVNLYSGRGKRQEDGRKEGRKEGGGGEKWRMEAFKGRRE